MFGFLKCRFETCVDIFQLHVVGCQGLLKESLCLPLMMAEPKTEQTPFRVSQGSRVRYTCLTRCVIRVIREILYLMTFIRESSVNGTQNCKSK
jgi:hypothetical protein